MPPPPAAGSRSTITLQSSTNLVSLPHAPVEGCPIPTWSLQESYETIVSTQGGYHADTFTAPPVAQQSSGGAIAHGSAYDNDPGVTYHVMGQSASNAAAPDDSAHEVGVVAPTPAPKVPVISQPPPIDVSTEDANNLQPRSVESQPAPGWRPGGSKWLNVYFWYKEVAMKTRGTSYEAPGCEQAPSFDETSVSTPRPMRTTNPTPGGMATPTAQPPPIDVNANGANNVQPSGTSESQPDPSWRPGGIKWLNIRYWATGVALKTSCASYNDLGYEPSPQSDDTSASTPRPTRTTDATRGGMSTPTAAVDTEVDTLPTRVPSPNATPRPLRVINVTPGHTPTPRPAANTDTRPAQVPQPSGPAFDVDAMVARAYDETAQDIQETQDQTTTCITELAVVVTERRLIVSSHV